MTEGDRRVAAPRVLLRGPYPPPFGGIASLIVSLVSRLRDHGAEEVVVLHYGPKNSVETAAGATIYCVALKSHAWRLMLPGNWSLLLYTLLTLRGARLRFRQLVLEATKAVVATDLAERHRCNVVSFYQSDVSMELLACSRKWRRTRSIILTVFGEIHDTPEFIESRRDLFQRLLAAPSAVLSSSAHCAKSFRPIGVQRAIEVIYVGVDLDRFADDGALRRQYRAELGVGDDTVVILFMGRFSLLMGLDAIIEMIPGLTAAKDRVKIVLAGARGDLSPMAVESARAHPDHVEVMNDVPFAALPSLYAASDVVLAPSRDQHACMGVSIKEAMAASRAVVGSDSGGIPEAIKDGETGLVVALNTDGTIDRKAFEAAILSLVSDRQRRTEMGRNARRRAESLFSERVTATRTMDVIRRCMPRG